MTKNIEEAVNEVLPDSRGRFRYRMVVAGLVFFSEPIPKDRFLMEFDNMISEYADITSVQYESKNEHTPGNYVWQTF
jgi:hypothetical protein